MTDSKTFSRIGIPRFLSEKIEKHVLPERQFVDITEYIRHLIYEDLRKRGIR